jgi:hypothetical protein
MPRAILSCLRALACLRGSTMVAYTSALLMAMAVITLLGHTETETGGASRQRGAEAVSSN